MGSYVKVPCVVMSYVFATLLNSRFVLFYYLGIKSIEMYINIIKKIQLTIHTKSLKSIQIKTDIQTGVSICLILIGNWITSEIGLGKTLDCQLKQHNDRDPSHGWASGISCYS